MAEFFDKRSGRAERIQSHYRRTDMSMLELTPEFIKDFSVYFSTERGLANDTIKQRCMWLKETLPEHRFTDIRAALSC